MSIYSCHFPMGLGTTRLPINGPDDTDGFEKSVQLVVQALQSGIDYIDVGHTYAAGMSSKILKEAFGQAKRPASVTVKVASSEDTSADAARRRVEGHLKAMGLEKACYFTCWHIWSWADFQQITKRDGIYDGALRLKNEGIIEHICCSLHAPPEDMIRIIESETFEGITISYSLLNASQMQPVLDTALHKNVGVVVMNPLGGGLIPQNCDRFSFACGKDDGGNTVHAALRFVKAHPAVNVVLCGVSGKQELEDDLKIFQQPDPEGAAARMARVLKQASGLEEYCTGCKYCEGCPKGIPTYALMQSRNAVLFEPPASYNRQGPLELLQNLQIFRKLHYDYHWLPDSAESPCVGCGHCERSCTQKLGIIDGVADIYRRAGETGYTMQARKDRLWELLANKGFRRVGLYPNGGFSNKVIELTREVFGEGGFEWLLFNSNTETWGKKYQGLTIHAPSEIQVLRPDVILVCSYSYGRDIADSLKTYEQKGIPIELLHRDTDVPWVF